MATLRLEFTNDENSKSIEISSDVNNLEEVDNLITDFRSLIVREKFTAEADDEDQLNFEFDGQTLMYADGGGQLNGQYGTSTDTKTTWEKVVDQEVKYRELDNSRLTDEEDLKTTWPFPKERPADSGLYDRLDRPAQATLRVDSDSKDEDPEYFSASDYRSAYYGGA